MTALNLIIKPDAAHVLTDGALSGANGEIVGTGAKAFPFPHSRSVYVGRGLIHTTLGTLFGLNTLPNIDVMAERLPRMVRDVHTQVAGELKGMVGEIHSDHLIAGWSDQEQAFTAFFLTTLARHGHEAYAATQLRGLVTPPTALPIDLADPNLNPATDGLRILREQRGTAEMGSAVGGFAQLTSVYADRIDTRILERWS